MRIFKPREKEPQQIFLPLLPSQTCQQFAILVAFMFHSRFISFTLLLWLFLSPSVQTARNSYESLYSGSGYALQTDSGNPPYSVAGRFVVSMRRSYFNVAGERTPVTHRLTRNCCFLRATHAACSAALGCADCTGRGTSQDMCGSLCATGVDGVTRT